MTKSERKKRGRKTNTLRDKMIEICIDRNGRTERKAVTEKERQTH
jgi:hypothetical protein